MYQINYQGFDDVSDLEETFVKENSDFPSRNQEIYRGISGFFPFIRSEH